MKKIVVSEILDKMVLAKPLVGGTGKILMAAGTELRSSMIERLKSWGVLFAYIHTEEDEVDAKQAADRAADIEALEERFEGTLDNPNMDRLFKEIKQYILEKG